MRQQILFGFECVKHQILEVELVKHQQLVLLPVTGVDHNTLVLDSFYLCYLFLQAH